MKTDPTIIFVNGIMHEPGSADSWVRRAALWVTSKTEFDGIVFLYEASALFRRLTLNKRARELAETMLQFRDRELHVVAHSNGAEVLTRAIRHILQHPDRPEPLKITSVHLCGPANDSDFTENWLNSALIVGLVREVHVYRAREDAALWWGNLSRKLFGWAGLGYGNLGRSGPQNVSDSVKHRVHDWPDVAPGHTEFFTGKYFEATLNRIVQNCIIAAGRGPMETRS